MRPACPSGRKQFYFSAILILDRRACRQGRWRTGSPNIYLKIFVFIRGYYPLMTTEEPTINLEQWLQDHGDILYRYALARLRNPSAAEDVVQETFLATMKAKERFS